MVDITLRRATAEDSKRLTRLVRTSSAYAGEYAAMVSGYQVGGSYIEHHPVYVAVDQDDRVLGFYALLLDEAELDLAFVSDEAQGRGIGRLLMEHMVAEGRAAGLTSIRVVAHPPAEEFYLRTGARRTGTIHPTGGIHWARPELRFDLTAAADAADADADAADADAAAADAPAAADADAA
ncbi:GNAT family N-acetyltransferase [Streptomyces vilmorinianum]|uniref:GNAT family N-acetyltransferase n=1 Tax=Streptomyces vilmorinianum TaxID=3051092 RepID=UPI0010FB162B|nr:GNAT family N-acetyltransferase [Streptomyces vilmorinianum]